MNYPYRSEIVRILKSYGMVRFYKDNGMDKCTLRSFWEPGMPRSFKYVRTSTVYLTGKSAAHSSYNDLYHAMLFEVDEVEDINGIS